MEDVWDLIKAGRFVEACRAADQEAAEDPSDVLPLRNKVLALLKLGQHQAAAVLCEEIIRRDRGESDSDFIFLGVAFWLQGLFDLAVGAWERGLNTKFTDAAGGVEVPLLLRAAGIRTGDAGLTKEAMRLLARFSGDPRRVNWPAPLAGFVLGSLSEAQVRELFSSQPMMRAKHICQSAFHFGIAHLAVGDHRRFVSSMRECCSQGPITLLKQEYYLGMAELAEAGAEPK